MTLFIKRGDRVHGPFSKGQIKAGLKSGKIHQTDRISTNKDGPWQPLPSPKSASASPQDHDQSLNTASEGPNIKHANSGRAKRQNGTTKIFAIGGGVLLLALIYAVYYFGLLHPERAEWKSFQKYAKRGDIVGMRVVINAIYEMNPDSVSPFDGTSAREFRQKLLGLQLQEMQVQRLQDELDRFERSRVTR